MTDTDTIFITMCSKESYEGESHCLIERWFLYIRATPPPRPVSRGLCTISYVGGNSSARQMLSFPSPLSHDSVTKVKSISLRMMSSWIANSIYVSANNVFLTPNNVGVPASIISVSSNASPVQLFVSYGPIPTNNTPTNATPAYGMPSYSELGNILTSATQNGQTRARLLRYARPANMPANKEISKPMQRRLISSMLIDIDPQQYDEIIQAILPNMASNLLMSLVRPKI